MKRVNTSDLVPGMVTAEDVYNFNNQLILPRGIILTDSTITKLAFYSVLTLYVEDQLVVQSTQTDVLHHLLYRQAQAQSRIYQIPQRI